MAPTKIDSTSTDNRFNNLSTSSWSKRWKKSFPKEDIETYYSAKASHPTR